MKAREFYLQIQDKEVEFGELSAKYSEGDERITRGINNAIHRSQSTVWS